MREAKTTARLYALSPCVVAVVRRDAVTKWTAITPKERRTVIATLKAINASESAGTHLPRFATHKLKNGATWKRSAPLNGGSPNDTPGSIHASAGQTRTNCSIALAAAAFNTLNG